jgi:hypothetical protein
LRMQPCIAFLLIIAITMAASGRSTICLDNPLAETDEIRADEDWEAREIARQFIQRFEETGDIESLVKDLYVKDFSERLRQDTDPYFFITIEPEVAAQATDEDLRRHYATSLQFTYLSAFLYAAAGSARMAQSNTESGDDVSEPTIEEVLTQPVAAVLRSDPVLAAWMAEEFDNKGSPNESGQSADSQVATEDDSTEKRVEEDAQKFKDVEQLRHYLSAIEQAIKLMREHLKSLPVPRTWQALQDWMRDPEQERENDPVSPYVNVLTSEHFGAPKGTRLISLNILAFRMDLIQVDNQLKILHVYLVFD